MWCFCKLNGVRAQCSSRVAQWSRRARKHGLRCAQHPFTEITPTFAGLNAHKLGLRLKVQINAKRLVKIYIRALKRNKFMLLKMAVRRRPPLLYPRSSSAPSWFEFCSFRLTFAATADIIPPQPRICLLTPKTKTPGRPPPLEESERSWNKVGSSSV